MEQRWSFQQMVLEQPVIHKQKMNLDTDATPFIKIHS